jgi:eukaryotic-like serine/threonine-protein kinase
VTVYDAGEIDGVLFLAMQFVEGEDLGRLLKREGPPSSARTAFVITQVAAALDAAHARALVHRDVKPANVLVEGEHCYLADFGLTKLTGATAATMTGDVLGTLSYAAPEQIEGVGVDRRADVYALGCTAYECLVGETPFAHRTGAALLYAQLTEAPPRPSDRRSALPEAVDAVLARALAKAPAERFPTCGEFAAALTRALAGAAAGRAADPQSPLEVSASNAARVPLPRPLVRCRLHPIVGREQVLGGLGGALVAAQDGRRVVVSLAGEPGIGKTRLAAELAARACDAGATVLYGRADEDPVIPYEPFAEALRELVAHLDFSRLPPQAATLAPLVPELNVLGALTPVSDAGSERYRMFEGVARLLAHAGRASPVLLVLEDLQWADKASLLLFRHLLESAQVAQLAAIVSYRPLWVDDDHPLPDVLTGLARRHDVRHVALAGLTQEETGRLAAERLGQTPPAALVHALVERTSGNPLFIEELLRDAPDDPAATATALPETVRHVVRRRLERLSEPTQGMLAVAALLNGEFAPETLEAILGDDVEDALEEAQIAGVIVDHDGRYALAHSLIRDVLVARTPGNERRRLHLRIADALERRKAEPAVLARHFHAARARDQALRYSVAAARAASKAHGYEQAAALFTQAQELLAGQEDLGLLLELGDARLRAGQPRCLETFAAAADLARATGDATALAEAALGLAGRFSTPETSAADVAALEEALVALDPGDSELRVRVLSRLAQSAPEARARELAGEATAMAERLDDDRARLAALAARRAVPELVSLADRLGELEAAALGRHWLLQQLTAAGDRAGAQRELEVLATLADRLHQPLYHELVGDWRAQLALTA